MLTLFLFTILAAEPACLTVDRPHILASDLAKRVAVFGQLPANKILAAAPVPGARREWSPAQLSQLAAGQGITLGSSLNDSLCINRRTALQHEFEWEREIRSALDRIFGYQATSSEIEILSVQLAPAAPGKLSLERAGLRFDPTTSQYNWRARVLAEGSSGGVNLRFALLGKEKRLITVRALPAARVLTAEDLEWKEFPVRPELAVNDKMTQLPIGQILRRSLPAGTPLLAQHLMEAPLILPGETVELTSVAGQARIRTQAVSRSKARLGEPVIVSLKDLNRLVRGIAVAPGQVEIQSVRNPK